MGLITVKDAKERIIQSVKNPKNSIRCPCCSKTTSSVRIHVNHVLRFYLQRIYQYGNKEKRQYVHVNSEITDEILVRQRRYAYLKYWYLIEAMPGKSEKTKTKGLWRVTKLGEEFLKGEAEIEEWLILYNKKIIERSLSLINIHEVSEEPFDFWKMMRGEMP